MFRKIPVSNIPDLFIIVDEDDFYKIINYKWSVYKTKDYGSTYYARTYIKELKKNVLLHRFIMNCDDEEKRIIDHINNNGLDCRKLNLRFSNHTLNNMNRRIQRNNKSGYRGVCWNATNKKWSSQIQYKRKQIFIGNFDDKRDAAIAYNKMSKKLFKEHAYLNEVE